MVISQINVQHFESYHASRSYSMSIVRHEPCSHVHYCLKLARVNCCASVKRSFCLAISCNFGWVNYPVNFLFVSYNISLKQPSSDTQLITISLERESSEISSTCRIIDTPPYSTQTSQQFTWHILCPIWLEMLAEGVKHNKMAVGGSVASLFKI